MAAHCSAVSSSVGSSTTGTSRPDTSRTISRPCRLPDGEMGKAVQVALQLRLHPLRDSGDAEGGGVGNAALLGKRAEKHRVKAAVRENFRVPDLVAAGENHIVGQCPRAASSSQLR